MGVSYTVNGVAMKTPGWHLRTAGTSWRPLPGVRATTVRVPGRPGAVVVPDPDEDDTTLGWTLSISDATPSGAPGGIDQLNANIDALYNLFGARHRLLDVRQTIASATATTVRQADAMVINSATPDVNPGALVATLPVVLTVPGVWWRDVDAAVFTAPAPVPLGQALDVATLAGATAPIVDAVLRLTGPWTNPRITDPVTGEWVSWTGTVPTGSQLRIRCAEWDAHLAPTVDWTGAGANATAGLDSSAVSRLLRLVPDMAAGDPFTRRVQVMLGGTGTDAETRFEIRARRAYR